jgi:hypothetical protein
MRELAMQVEGACHCGRIRFEAQIDPAAVRLCHCTDCQTLSGTAYRVNVDAPADSFRLLSGQPRIYIKTAESGNQRAQAFCPDCGSPIYAAAAQDPRSYSLRVGALKQRAQLRPSRQIWLRSALSWVTDLREFLPIERQ